MNTLLTLNLLQSRKCKATSSLNISIVDLDPDS